MVTQIAEQQGLGRRLAKPSPHIHRLIHIRHTQACNDGEDKMPQLLCPSPHTLDERVALQLRMGTERAWSPS